MEINSYSLVERLDFANVAAGGNIATAAVSVDIAACFSVNQTTVGQTLTLPNPSDTRNGRLAYVMSIGTAAFVMHGQRLLAAKAGLFQWHNGAWRTLSGASGLDVLTTVQPAPTPIGNTTNLNTIFNDANGNTWAVDDNGDAIALASSLSTTSLTPEVYLLGAYTNAQASAASPLADLIKLSNGTRVDAGKVKWTAHGLTVGAYYYLSQTVAGAYTTVAPTSGWSQRLFFVEDVNTIHIDVEPAVFVSTATGTPGLSALKVTPADLTIAAWAAPWTTVPIPALDIVVPPNSWVDAEYNLLVNTGQPAWGIGLKNTGFAAGDTITGRVSIPNFTPPTAASGNAWFELLLNNTVFDVAPNTTRQADTSMGATTEMRVFLKVRYKNATAGAKTFGWSFGADISLGSGTLNLVVKAGSSVVYTIY